MMSITDCRIITHVLLCRYMPFKANYNKEAIRQIDRGEGEPPQADSGRMVLKKVLYALDQL